MNELQVGEVFAPAKGGRVVGGLVGGVMTAGALGLGWLAWSTMKVGSEDQLIAGGFAAFLAVVGVVMLRYVAFSGDRSFSVRDDGVEGPDGSGSRQFVPWGRMQGIRIRPVLRRVEITDIAGEVLLRVSLDLTDAGRLIHILLTRGVLPKKRVAIPLRLEQAGGPPVLPRLLAISAGIAMMMLAIGQNVVAAVAGGISAVLGLAALLGRRFGTRTVEVRREGIAKLKGEEWQVREWSTLEGVGLFIFHGPKGQKSPVLGIKPVGGDWTGLQIRHAQWEEFLAAAFTVDPNKVLPPPDGLMLALAFSTEPKFVVRKGLAKLQRWV